MTREQIAARIHWPLAVWVLGVMNSFFMAPQLWEIITTRRTEGVSLTMFALLIAIQYGFAVHGFFIRSSLILWSNVVAGTFSTFTALSVVYLRM